MSQENPWKGITKIFIGHTVTESMCPRPEFGGQRLTVEPQMASFPLSSGLDRPRGNILDPH